MARLSGANRYADPILQKVPNKVRKGLSGMPRKGGGPQFEAIVAGRRNTWDCYGVSVVVLGRVRSAEGNLLRGTGFGYHLSSSLGGTP